MKVVSVINSSFYLSLDDDKVSFVVDTLVLISMAVYGSVKLTLTSNLCYPEVTTVVWHNLDIHVESAQGNDSFQQVRKVISIAMTVLIVTSIILHAVMDRIKMHNLQASIPKLLTIKANIKEEEVIGDGFQQLDLGHINERIEKEGTNQLKPKSSFKYLYSKTKADTTLTNIEMASFCDSTQQAGTSKDQIRRTSSDQVVIQIKEYSRPDGQDAAQCLQDDVELGLDEQSTNKKNEKEQDNHPINKNLDVESQHGSKQKTQENYVEKELSIVNPSGSTHTSVENGKPAERIILNTNALMSITVSAMWILITLICIAFHSYEGELRQLIVRCLFKMGESFPTILVVNHSKLRKYCERKYLMYILSTTPHLKYIPRDD